MNRTALILTLFLVWLAPRVGEAESQQLRTHVVYEGQRLGSIAKRYNVSIEALALANGIRREDTIRPGQRLLIPSRDDPKGERAAARAQNTAAPQRAQPPATTARPKQNQNSARVHRVEAGQRLESIARRHAVSVDALCSANGIHPRSIIRPGQYLTIPSPNGGPSAVSSASSGRDASSYSAYFRAPKVKDRVELIGYNETYRGRVFDEKGRFVSKALAGISRVLGTTGSRPKADPRLIRLLVQVSNRFGGRPLRIVSGYRTTSYYDDSRHKASRAVDFSVVGVPNEALRDYLRSLSNVGVGYYPNSSFVHLDVREYAAYWVDYSGPGEAPRRTTAPTRLAAERHDDGPQTTPTTLTAATQFEALERALEVEARRAESPRTRPAALPQARSTPESP